ncbi:MAG: glycerate kinase [Ruminococcus sp.]|nr:glycerate kinase [Candidatus Copronaster equi]
MIVIAPDSYKGTMSAVEVCEIIKKEFLSVIPELDVRCVPIADGGEGTVDAFLFNGGEKITCEVTGPLNEKVEAFYGILPDSTAVIEMAAASGLPLVGDKKNPLLTTTYGTGELIKNALDKGCKKILIGIGGSATNDGGIGCAGALGVKFLDENGNGVSLNGSGLSEICDIDLSGLDKRLKETEIKVLCDVISPLYGKTGATYVFSAQKGADEKMMIELDNGLKNLADVAVEKLLLDNAFKKGAGAAGGLGYGLMTFIGAELVNGAQAVLEANGFAQIAEKSQLVITGEGCMDNQSILGKAPAQVAKMSGDTPVIAIVGISKVTDMQSSNIRKIYVTDHDERTFEQVLLECRDDLRATAHKVAVDFKNNLI